MAKFGKRAIFYASTTDSPFSCLTKAAQRGQKSLIIFLLDSGINPNQTDGNGNAALHHAAGEGHVEIVRLLVDASADVNRKNRWNETPLHRASYRNRAAIIDELQRGKLIVDAVDENEKQGGT